jgi:hypothetical protein
MRIMRVELGISKVSLEVQFTAHVREIAKF